MAVLEIPFGSVEIDVVLGEMEEALKEYKAAIEKVKEAGAELAGELSGDEHDEFVARQEQLYQWNRMLAVTAEQMICLVHKKLEMDRIDFGDAVRLSMQQELKG